MISGYRPQSFPIKTMEKKSNDNCPRSEVANAQINYHPFFLLLIIALLLRRKEPSNSACPALSHTDHQRMAGFSYSFSHKENVILYILII